jgi:HSP20 family molecular chaperone IbpA
MKVIRWDQIQEVIAMGAKAPRVDMIDRPVHVVVHAEIPDVRTEDMDLRADMCVFDLHADPDQETGTDGIVEMTVPKAANMTPERIEREPK